MVLTASPKTVAASPNETLCYRRLFAVFSKSHSNTTKQVYRLFLPPPTEGAAGQPLKLTSAIEMYFEKKISPLTYRMIPPVSRRVVTISTQPFP